MDLQEWCKYVNSKSANLIYLASLIIEWMIFNNARCLLSHKDTDNGRSELSSIWTRYLVHIFQTPLTRQYQQACLSKQNTIISLRVLGGEETKSVLHGCLATGSSCGEVTLVNIIQTYGGTPLIRTLVIRIGLALRVNIFLL